MHIQESFSGEPNLKKITQNISHCQVYRFCENLSSFTGFTDSRTCSLNQTSTFAHQRTLRLTTKTSIFIATIIYNNLPNTIVVYTVYLIQANACIRPHNIIVHVKRQKPVI